MFAVAEGKHGLGHLITTASVRDVQLDDVFPAPRPSTAAGIPPKTSNCCRSRAIKATAMAGQKNAGLLRTPGPAKTVQRGAQAVLWPPDGGFIGGPGCRG
jgi:hypothetical protein